MKKITVFIIILLILMLSLPVISAEATYYDVEKMQEYNPDGEKYELVKSYLNSLTYIKSNAERKEKTEQFSSQELSDVSYGRALMDDLLKDNTNLRVARNLLKKYKKSDNGLILKTVDVFTKFCDEQIRLNNQERKLLDVLYEAQINDKMDEFDKGAFWSDQKTLATQRKESWKDVLRASMFIPKILISDQEDENGELVWLGITEEERMKLLLKLDKFYGMEYRGHLRAGQTFLEGSVVVIREILEDSSWKALPKKRYTHEEGR